MPEPSDTAPLSRRSAYEPASAQEYFIVTLLANRIHAVLRDLARARGGRALDIGCGEQPLRSFLTGLGYSYCGLDVQQNESRTVDVVTPIDRPIPVEVIRPASFDLIVCTEVLEHVADWDMAFHNLADLLAPGGDMLITCPHVYPLHEMPHDYWRPTPYALRYFADRAGLKIVRQESAGDGFDVLGTVLAAAEPVASGHGLLDRLMSSTANIARKAGFVLLRSPLFRRHVSVRSAFYLSNIAVLRRDAAPQR